MELRRHLRAALLVVLGLAIVTGSIAPAVIAQDNATEPENATENETEDRPPGLDPPTGLQDNATDTAENVTDDVTDTAENATGDGEDDDGLLPSPDIGMPSTPSTQDVWERLGELIVERGGAFLEWIYSNTVLELLGTPYPENDGWNGITGTPTNYPYSEVFEPLYEDRIAQFAWYIAIISIFLIAGLIPFSDLIGTYRAHQWSIFTFAMTLAFVLGWPIATWMQKTSHVVGMSLAPPPELVASQDGAITSAVAGTSFAAAIILTAGIKAIIYAVIYGFRYVILYPAPFAFMPLLVASLAAPHRKLRSLAASLNWQYIGLLVMMWPCAALFHFVYLIQWEFGIQNAVVNTCLVIGVLTAAWVIPVAISYSMFQIQGVAAGTAAGVVAGAAAMDPRRVRDSDRDLTGSAKQRAAGAKSRIGNSTAADTVSDIRKRIEVVAGSRSQRATSGPGGSTKGGVVSARATDGGGGGGGSTASRAESSSKAIKDYGQAKQSAARRGYTSPAERKQYQSQMKRSNT